MEIIGTWEPSHSSGDSVQDGTLTRGTWVRTKDESHPKASWQEQGL